jgi:hypothetical protein
MTDLAPLETLFDATSGEALPLPARLRDLYGSLRFPAHRGRPHVVGNIVSSMDGVVSLGISGNASGRAISGGNPHDRMVMGLLRAAADVVITGGGTFRSSARRRWTASRARQAAVHGECDRDRQRRSRSRLPAGRECHVPDRDDH